MSAAAAVAASSSAAARGVPIGETPNVGGVRACARRNLMFLLSGAEDSRLEGREDLGRRSPPKLSDEPSQDNPRRRWRRFGPVDTDSISTSGLIPTDTAFRAVYLGGASILAPSR